MPNQRRRRTFRLLLALVVLAAALVAGVYLMQRRGYRLDDALTTVVEKSTDAATAANVKTALALSRRVSAFDIDVDADGGAVTLGGRVPSLEVKSLAGSIVADTTGVREVRNLLEVDPKVSPDPEVERLVARVEELELQATLLEVMRSEPSLGEVVPEVRAGRVTLAGTVDSDADRELASRLARNLAPGRSLDDRLQLAAAPAAGDARVDERVEFALYSSGAFDLGRIEVVARGEEGVALQGTVRSRAEQILAERLARDTGVEVVVNELEVRSDSSSAREGTGEASLTEARP
jgi:osmotically-inducible protein OsmY